ncbi:heavy-metal-associated domain-containing protein [Natronoarchaeum sp. GCM10025703]|uniref:heavy-metal-associated domain-containing protein n=1 Tax=unclassified Natronoarchaeum TaxID=2620183 RepID=UPI0036076A30
MNETLQLRVLDFSCPSCANTVERAIGKLDGVADVEVHFTTGRVEVEYEESAVATRDIETIIEKQGYTPQPA